MTNIFLWFQLIELDEAKFDLFDMPPVKEYEMYMRSYGTANAMQAAVQTNDDNIEKEIQTEDIEYKTKWTQHPAEDSLGVGGEDADATKHADEIAFDSVKLSRFIKEAGRVIETLLGEQAAERMPTSSNKKSNIVVSEAFMELQTCPLLSGKFPSII